MALISSHTEKKEFFFTTTSRINIWVWILLKFILKSITKAKKWKKIELYYSRRIIIQMNMDHTISNGFLSLASIRLKSKWARCRLSSKAANSFCWSFTYFKISCLYFFSFSLSVLSSVLKKKIDDFNLKSNFLKYNWTAESHVIYLNRLS